MPRIKLFNEDVVLDNATRLFWSKGYNGTSIDDLVKATGISRSSLYDSFGDKHGLFIRSLQRYKQKNNQSLREALTSIASPKERIYRIFYHTLNEILTDRQRKGCFMVNSTTELSGQDKEAIAISCTNMQEMEKTFAQWVSQAQQAGEIPKRQPARAIARYLYSSFSGLQVVGQANPDKKVLTDIVEVTLSVLDK
jgi:TetR/AcrR family transcriptional regulator, transcriptional repressor for nem operon